MSMFWSTAITASPAIGAQRAADVRPQRDAALRTALGAGSVVAGRRTLRSWTAQYTDIAMYESSEPRYAPVTPNGDRERGAPATSRTACSPTRLIPTPL